MAGGQVLSSAFARRLGRPDAASAGVPGTAPTQDPYTGSSVAVTGSVQAGQSIVGGRLTGGVLIGLIVGLGVFYIWTRGVQQ